MRLGLWFPTTPFRVFRPGTTKAIVRWGVSAVDIAEIGCRHVISAPLSLDQIHAVAIAGARPAGSQDVQLAAPRLVYRLIVDICPAAHIATLVSGAPLMVSGCDHVSVGLHFVFLLELFD